VDGTLAELTHKFTKKLGALGLGIAGVALGGHFRPGGRAQKTMPHRTILKVPLPETELQEILAVNVL
jgi:hypothetical protein